MAKRCPFKLRIKYNSDAKRGEDKRSDRDKRSDSSSWTKKSATTNWRDNLKATNPERYKQVLKENANYKKLKRLDMALAESMLQKRKLGAEEKKKWKDMLEQKKKYNEGCAYRMRQHRAVKKANQHNKPPKPLTRTQRQKVSEKKAKAAAKRREERAAMSPEEKKVYLAHRRVGYAQRRIMEKRLLEEAKKLKKQQKEIEEEERRLAELKRKLEEQEDQQQQMRVEMDESDVDIRRPEARRKSLQRARNAMPLKPANYINTHEDLRSKASPTKSRAFTRRDVLEGAGASGSKQQLLEGPLFEVIAIGLAEEKQSRHRKKLACSLHMLKKYKLQRAAAKKFGVSRKLLSKAKQFTTGRKQLSEEIVNLVKDFYEAESQAIPDKKRVSKKTGKPTSFMDRSVSVLYSRFKKRHPEIKIGIAKFHQLRPTNVKTRSQAKYKGCLCEYCENISLKLPIINKYLSDAKCETIRGVYDLADATLCGKPHKYECIYRECQKCGIDMLDDRLGSILSVTSKLSWKRWKLVQSEVASKDVLITKRSLVDEDGQMCTLIEELKGDAQTYAAHLFQKDWQHKQYSALKSRLPEDTCVCVLDFAENYKCAYQNEVQGAYWTQNSATVHPIVCYYNCQKCKTQITESLVFITDDLTHDHHAVNAFQAAASMHLKNTRSLQLKKLYRYSDGCGVQYKSRGPFSDVSYAMSDFGYPIEHIFAGSRHGKGPSDGESAVVKSRSSLAVKTEAAVITNAEDLYKFAKKELTRNDEDCNKHGFRRTCFYIPRKEIERDRGHRLVKTVPGTMKLHSVRTIKDGIIATRNLSCYCNACLLVDGTECQNKQYVQEWKEVKLFKRSRSKATSQGHEAAALTTDDGTASEPEDESSEQIDDSTTSGHDIATPKHKGVIYSQPNDNNPSQHDDKASTKHEDGAMSERGFSVNSLHDFDAKIEVNNYVAIQFERSDKDWVYMAMVTLVHNDQAQVEFMQRHENGLYTFSTEPPATHPFSDLVKMMASPTLVRARRALMYKFSDTETSALSSKFILK